MTPKSHIQAKKASIYGTTQVNLEGRLDAKLADLSSQEVNLQKGSAIDAQKLSINAHHINQNGHIQLKPEVKGQPSSAKTREEGANTKEFADLSMSSEEELLLGESAQVEAAGSNLLFQGKNIVCESLINADYAVMHAEEELHLTHHLEVNTADLSGEKVSIGSLGQLHTQRTRIQGKTQVTLQRNLQSSYTSSVVKRLI